MPAFHKQMRRTARPLSRPRIIICGHAEHGKDTVAEILLNTYGLSYQSSSWIAMEKFIFAALAPRYGYHDYAECFADRVNHRGEWYDLISNYNADIPDRLLTEIFETYDVYAGLRSYRELNYHLYEKEPTGTLAIWIDAFPRKSAESIESNTVTWDMCHVVLLNAGPQEELHMNIRVIMEEYCKVIQFTNWTLP